MCCEIEEGLAGSECPSLVEVVPQEAVPFEVL